MPQITHLLCIGFTYLISLYLLFFDNTNTIPASDTTAAAVIGRIGVVSPVLIGCFEPEGFPN